MPKEDINLNIRKSKKRIDSLQALRMLAFFGVFALHAGLRDTGSWGVSVFVVMSGFLMVYSYIDRELPAGITVNTVFAAVKMKKLYPLHIIMMVITIFLSIGWDFSNMSLQYFNPLRKERLIQLLLIQAWIPDPMVYFDLNSVAWYLSACVFLYFMFPWLLKIIRGYKNIFSALAAMVSTYLLMTVLAAGSYFAPLPAHIFPNPTGWFTYICPLFRLGDFFIGCNLGYLFIKLPYEISKARATLLEIFTVAVLLITQFIHEEQIIYIGGEWFRHTLLYVPSSLMLVWVFAHSKGYITKLLTNKITVFAGDISAYCFLIHAVVLVNVKNMLKATAYAGNVYATAIIGLAITVILSVFYRYMEKTVKNVLAKKQ